MTTSCLECFSLQLNCCTNNGEKMIKHYAHYSLQFYPSLIINQFIFNVNTI